MPGHFNPQGVLSPWQASASVLRIAGITGRWSSAVREGGGEGKGGDVWHSWPFYQQVATSQVKSLNPEKAENSPPLPPPPFVVIE